jgi:hypothetical protein
MSDLITLPRATVQQALEALENSSPDQYPEDAGVFYDAKDALRAALEQPEQAEPEWLTGCPSCGMDGGCDCDEGTYNPPRREWRGLKEWEINDGRDQLPTEDLCNWSFRQGVYFAEKALKERNA